MRELDEFNRFKILIGDNFIKVANLKILVLGVGGVGGYVVESLVRSGVSNITIIDSDDIDITNLNRQIISLHSNIGQKKVDVLRKRILDINPKCAVTTFDLFYNSDNKDSIFNQEYDYVVDCCDTIKSKEIIIRECINRKINIISSMGAGFKYYPEEIKIAKLKDTCYDKIAKVLRHNLRDNKECLNIPVVFSTEIVDKKSEIIGSNSYIPAMFGLYITSYIINEVIDK